VCASAGPRGPNGSGEIPLVFAVCQATFAHSYQKQIEVCKSGGLANYLLFLRCRQDNLLNKHAGRRSKLLVGNIASVTNFSRLEEDDLNFLLSDRPVFKTSWNNEELACM
jgi:hypothetical protein